MHTVVPSGLLIATLLGCVFHAAASPAPVFKLAALSKDDQLVLFRSDAPGSTTVVKISGTDAALTGIDVRPANRKLYGLSQGETLFVIDTQTGMATRVSKLTSPFGGGMASGFDFNPQSDRLRLVAADTRMNLRVNVDLGAVAIDDPLSFAASDVHSGRRPAIAAAAYTNSVAKARNTVLYVIDFQLDALIQQDPPNEGVLTTIGELGVDCDAATGFDIATDARGKDYAFLVCKSDLYGLNITTGAAQPLGRIGGGFTELVSLAVLPEP